MVFIFAKDKVKFFFNRINGCFGSKGIVIVYRYAFAVFFAYAVVFAVGIVVIILEICVVVLLRVVGNNGTVFNHDYAAAKVAYKLVFMGYHDNRCTAAVNFGKQFYDFVGHVRVNVSGRLVGDNHSRVVNKRSCQANTLLFAARKLVRLASCLAAKADKVKRI